MTILFLTMMKISSVEERGIYSDLLRKFRDQGHQICILSPVERNEGKRTHIIQEKGVRILKVRTFNLQKANLIEKGIGTLAIEYQYLSAIKKYLNDIRFDLILYSTPPITFAKVIKFIKKRDHAYAYLLLKDIFPQNAVDLKMMKRGGFLHRFFLKKEKKLYVLSDTIGCMSTANVNYLIKHNPYINSLKVEVNPNSIDPIFVSFSEAEAIKIKKKYKLPLDKKILVYGGNFGKPQGLRFLTQVIDNCTSSNVFFLIVGGGTQSDKLWKWYNGKERENTQFLNLLPKNEFDLLLRACDIGLIFLHPDFTIPNFPSRLLSYLEMKMPVIAATDPNTDIGQILERYNCGKSVLSGDLKGMLRIIEEMTHNEEKLAQMKENAGLLLRQQFTTEISYQLIMEKIGTNIK